MAAAAGAADFYLATTNGSPTQKTDPLVIERMPLPIGIARTQNGELLIGVKMRFALHVDAQI
jgi:hypothetical protein